MTVLVTGYEPFGDHESNPSAAVARRLDGETVADREVVGRVVPVAFDRTRDELVSLVDEHDPVVVVSTGLAGGRSAVSVERVGVNVDDHAGVPDNDDATPRHERIDGDGPDAYFSTLPVPAVVADLNDAGIPARLSNTAGTHLCNHALYTVRAYVEREGLGVSSGFVHLPYSPAMAARRAADGEAESGGSVPPSMSLDLQTEAVERVLATTLGSRP
ncbi:MAG: pyroglutamyl-peptidase I [Haloferacaceae archaeon]